MIIPCYKCVDVISHAMDSLLQQTMAKKDMEIILVNDDSPDDSLEVLYSYESEHPELITVINCEENMGQAVARNIGLQYARGEFIAFLDQDD